ncbi:hypothetical protein [Streptosporangium subroseum]|uniref:hypothetical protein n=1 Tax=Streptosporangium subroseum TaxID=106412 RepID=UPI003F4D948F
MSNAIRLAVSRTLEVGSGGHNAALIREVVGLSGSVTTIDIDPDVTSRAERYLVGASRHRAVRFTVLLDVGTGSRADNKPNPGGGWTVHRHGPLRLWDTVEDSVLMWQAAGSPHQSAFGLTVTKDRQYVWLGEPNGRSWDLPA